MWLPISVSSPGLLCGPHVAHTVVILADVAENSTWLRVVIYGAVASSPEVEGLHFPPLLSFACFT